jgi:hypothetical protein
MWARKQKSGARMAKLGLVSMKYMHKFEKNEEEMCMKMCQNGKVRTSVCEKFAGSYKKNGKVDYSVPDQDLFVPQCATWIRHIRTIFY